MSPADQLSSSKKKQCTLKKSVSLDGVGLFTGVKTTVTLQPAPENTGIVFKRVDLPGQPVLPARVCHVQETPRCTIIGNKEFRIQTIEHILSALRGLDIDNAIIEVDAAEIPSCDGSALPFVGMIEKAGIAHQNVLRKVYHVDAPIFWSRGDVQLVALPSDELRISYTLNYPDCDLLKSQFFSFLVNSENYKNEIAGARTFSLYEEIVPLIEKGNIKGGTLDNAVIIKGDKILNPEGVRYEDEMARHKILDLIGDLSLVGARFSAHIVAIRSGHFSNTALARELVDHFGMEAGSYEHALV